jgi:hypothetical protein
MITKRDIDKLEKELNSWIAGISDVARVEVEFNKNSTSWLVGILYDLSMAEIDAKSVLISGDGLKMFIVALKNDLKEYLSNKEKDGVEREEDYIEYTLKEKEAMVKINIWEDQYQYYTTQIFNIEILS